MRAGSLTLGALLTTAALLSGCSGGAAPLGVSTYGLGCAGFDAPPGQIHSFGSYVLQNQSRSMVTIQSVTLGTTSHGLKMTGGAWVMPIIGHNMIALGEWPPDRPPQQTPMAPAWALRRRADGAQIKPGQTRELMLGVARTTTKPGWSGGPVIVYTAGGSTFTLRKSPAIFLGQGRCLPGKSYA
ncbi:MAG: hypothetical protein J2P27_07955 [Actinobacteria bacterium]|nr:hypothetical protein [Actinomycetota bacterium]